MGKKIAIVGAGIGGLAAAARLSNKSHDVEVFEKLPECGGRTHLLQDKGFKFDMGPSFVMMPDFFEEVFNYCGQDIKDYLDLQALDPSYKIFYPDGDSLTVYKDSRRTAEELERIEKGAGLGFEGFIKETTRIYKSVRPLLYNCFSRKELFNPKYLGLAAKIRPLESYWQLAKQFFNSDKLCYAFTFEAMFMGVSPFEAPAFYSVISYADHVQKIYHPMGGMYRIPLSLESMAVKFGAKFHYNSEVKKISRNSGTISLEFNTKKMDFDRVVVNADYAYAQSELLGRSIPDYRYSCSVYLIYLGLKRKTEGFAHHNLFFSADLKKNLSQIFHENVIPEDPSFYVHVPTVTDASLAPQGKEIFYILVPVPNLTRPQEDLFRKEDRLRRTVFDRINRVLGADIEDLVETEHRFYPQDFISRYNIKYAATFGLAHNLMQSAFLRPANFDRKIKGLYFAGASTQPGGGLPVVIASSKIVADMIQRS
ncbi:MAG: phytoene desaturase family protein [Candidatus Omnitrophica bacterium]|nr:phytoene desaturase family protein [Candidatus Omnitrophota bacterium]